MPADETRDMIPQAEAEKKKDLISSAKHLLGSALSPLRGRDSNQQLEEFTSEMTLVAEGLSEDQMRISRLLDNVAAEQTVFENDVTEKLDQLSGRIGENVKLLKTLTERLEKLEKASEEKKKKKTEGWTELIRSLTWLVGIASGAGIIITILNKVL